MRVIYGNIYRPVHTQGSAGVHMYFPALSGEKDWRWRWAHPAPSSWFLIPDARERNHGEQAPGRQCTRGWVRIRGSVHTYVLEFCHRRGPKKTTAPQQRAQLVCRPWFLNRSPVSAGCVRRSRWSPTVAGNMQVEHGLSCSTRKKVFQRKQSLYWWGSWQRDRETNWKSAWWLE